MRLLKNIIYCSTASVFSKVLGFLLAFFIAKALGPAHFGVWITLMLLVSYSPIVSLGTMETLLKQLPYHLGRRDLVGVCEVENSVMGSIVLSALFIMILACATPLILRLTSFEVEAWLVVMVLITIATSYFSSYFYYRFSAYQDFTIVGGVDFGRAIAALLYVGGLGWIWGLPGAVVGYLLHETTVCLLLIFINVKTRGNVGINFRGDLIIRAVRIGFPITLVWWSFMLTGSVDRIVLGALLGPLSVGHYGLGISVSGSLILVPTVVGRILYPKVNEQLGEGAGSEIMRRVVVAPTLAIGTLLVNCQIILLIITPLLYNQLLPKYQPGLAAGQILVLGSFFVCVLRNGANYLIAANQERSFLKYIVITLAFNLVMDITLVSAGFGIEGVAIATSLAGLLLTTLVWRRVLSGLGFRNHEKAIGLIGVYMPIVVLACAALFVRLLYPAAFRIFNSTSVFLGLGLLAFVNGVLCCFPLYRREVLIWLELFSRTRRTITASPANRQSRLLEAKRAMSVLFR
jgi:O-antigen/teichoic acid export membrane protein